MAVHIGQLVLIQARGLLIGAPRLVEALIVRSRNISRTDCCRRGSRVRVYHSECGDEKRKKN